MKYLILIIVSFMIVVAISAQSRASFDKIVHHYFCERDSSLTVTFFAGEISVSSKMNEGRDFVVRNELFSSRYVMIGDTIYIGKYVFLTNKEGELVSLQSIPCSSSFNGIMYWVFKNEKLYPLNYYTENNRRILYGGKWKNGFKEGKWVYVDCSGKESGVIFKEGIIVASFNIPPLIPDIIEDM